MDPITRWRFDPFDAVRPLRQHENSQQQNLPRSRSLDDLQQQRPMRSFGRPPADRKCKNVPYPIVHKLRVDELFDDRWRGRPNIGLLVHHLKNEGRLAEPTWRRLVSQAKTIFSQEPNVIRLSPGCTIVGDIHGQYYDLLTILDLGGSVDRQQYVFLGDYVDRGSFSCECLFLLLTLKLNYPRLFFLLRGNHESRQMTEVFTFRKECQVKYSLDLWHESMALFDCLPLCALIDDRFLCMHAGLSPYLRYIDDIMTLNRFQEIPHQGPLCDLMWSDPHRQFADRQTPAWIFNDTRKCSFFFNYKVCQQFLIENRLLAIIRAHEVVPNGLVLHEKGSQSQFPVLVTLFSAPNYCDVYNNTAAIIIYDHQRNFRPIHFRHQPHPFVLPNHENGFEFGHRLMETYIQEIILVLLRNSTKSSVDSTKSFIDRSQLSNDQDDGVARRLKAKEQMLTEHTNRCRRMNRMNIALGNLAPSEQLTTRALNNEDVFNDENIHNFDSASKIDALYEERFV